MLPAVRRAGSSKKGETLAAAIFLVGFMGAGKSTVGRALGHHLGWDFEDLDDRIERLEGRTVAKIFRDSGEQAFRRAEHAALQAILEELRGGVKRVVALGGGTFAQEENHKVLQSSGVPTVFLAAPLEELWRRCNADLGAHRPLRTSAPLFRTTYEARERFYRTASRRIETQGKHVKAIVTEISEALGLKKIAPRTQQGDVE
jgi:shikimate kinase